MLFIYPLIFLLKIIPRKKDVWIFGNFKGFIDNTKYLYEFIGKEGKGNLEIYWITKDKALYDILRVENNSVLYYFSLKAFWKSIRAGVTFQANGYSDINKIAALNSFNVNLWHGFPIKNIVFDAELEFRFYSFGRLNGILTLLSSQALTFLNNKIDLYCVSSPFELERMSKAFRVSKDKFRITGTPRFDIINTKINESAKALKIFRKHNTTQGKNIMYAPTWRENGWNSKQILSDLKKLTLFLESKNYYFFIKRHPLTSLKEIESWGIKESNRIHFVDNFDINESYQFIDILITDFSSLIFDFGVLNKPIFYFISDLKEYSSNRGFYDNIVKISGNRISESWDELLERLGTNVNCSDYVNHQHFDYLLHSSPKNVRENIIKLVVKELQND